MVYGIGRVDKRRFARRADHLIVLLYLREQNADQDSDNEGVRVRGVLGGLDVLNKYSS